MTHFRFVGRVLRLAAVVAVIAAFLTGLSLGSIEPPAAAASAPFPVAHFIVPVVGSANVGVTQPFQWTTSPAAAMYYLTVGSSPGNGDDFSSFAPPSQSSLAIPPLPAGKALWARIWTEVAGQGWFFGEDVAFTVLPAGFTNPAVGVNKQALIEPFRWTAAPGAATYYLMLGSSPGNGDVFGGFVPASQTSFTTPPLPPGRVLWARIWTSMPTFGWYYGPDVSFTT